MKKIITFILFIIILLPIIFLITIGNDSISATFLKKTIVLLMSFLIVFIPFIFLKSKWAFYFLGIFIPLSFLEIYHINLFQVPLTEGIIASILNTHFHESIELIQQNYYWILLSIITTTCYFLLVKKSNLQIAKRTKLISLVFFIGFFTSIFLRDLQIAKKQIDAGFSKNMKLALSNFTYKFEKIYPINLILHLSAISTKRKDIKKYEEKIADFKFNCSKKNQLNGKEIYVLILGETARRYNFSLYNYHRKTNPLLAQDSVLAFTNISSASNLTLLSLPIILTRSTPTNLEAQKSEKCLIKAFEEANFNTYWLSNQPYFYGNLTYFFPKQAQHFTPLNTSFDLDGAYDGVLLNEFKKVLQKKEQKQLIILHTIGSHYRYNYRYPKEFEQFIPCNNDDIMSLRNSYDNTILYTDYLLHELISELKKENATSFLCYLSDHGENLEDNEQKLLFHGSPTPTKYEIEIPLICWASKNYKKNYPIKYNNLQKNINSKISSTNIFHSFLDIAALTYPTEDKRQSIADSSFKEQKRYFLKVDNSVIEISDFN